MKKFNVTGMTCAACSSHVEKAVNSVEGVSKVMVNLLTNSMQVEGSASDDAIIKAVVDAGYGASVMGSNGSEKQAAQSADDLKDTETPRLLKRLIVSVILLLPLMYVSMGHMMWNWPLPEAMAENHIAMGIYQMLFAIIIMVINQKFFINGFKGLLRRTPNMDTLVGLGSAASFAYSVYALFAMTGAQLHGDMDGVMAYMHEFYFESAAMILTLITVGKTLEAYSKGRTTDALKSLMRLAPQTATVLRDGVEVEVGIEDVNVDDIFVVKPGESIPVDGIVLKGMSAIDESALTGESIPVDKEAGDKVSAATINQSGHLTCKATRVGKDTTLSQIIQMVTDASATKAPIAKIADRVSGVFVPTVLIIAAVTFVIWLMVGQAFGFSLSRAISVLVISCPCALGLATPVAIMVGNGISAKNGILFKNAIALENTGKVDIVALDKTGTITNGRPVVTDLVVNDGFTEEQLLALSVSMEAKSEHPLAVAISTYGEEHQIRPLEVENFRAVAGNGLSAVYEGAQAYAGNDRFIGKKVSIPDQMKKQAMQLAEAGKTPLYFAIGGKLAGMIAVADTIKEESAQAIRELQNMGVRVIMLTGDNKRTADAIGKLARVDDVIAGVLPDGKEAVIRSLREVGKVAMVGDGINDAPALTRADIGIAIGAGSDVAIDAADVVLVNSHLTDVSAALRISRRVIRNIHENLFWAFIYNVIGIPLAAGAWYYLFGLKLNPMFGAAAMSLSSVCVVTNALRLNFIRVRSTARDKVKQNVVEKSAIDAVVKSYEVKENSNMEKIIEINGMMCKHCEKHMREALEALDGVESAVTSHVDKTAVVTLSKDIPDEVFKKAVEDCEYEFVGVRA